jgi:hypothetical protein
MATVSAPSDAKSGPNQCVSTSTASISSLARALGCMFGWDALENGACYF